MNEKIIKIHKIGDIEKKTKKEKTKEREASAKCR